MATLAVLTTLAVKIFENSVR